MSLRVFIEVIDGARPGPTLRQEVCPEWGCECGQRTGLAVYPRSLAGAGRSVFFMGSEGGAKYLAILSEEGVPGFSGTLRSVEIEGRRLCLQVCPTRAENAALLRKTLPFAAPRIFGVKKSAGLGDRLGLATPGHVRALRTHEVMPVFAQQSMREMERLGRTPGQVMDDACWGIFQEGWQQGFGADADHLKTTDDIDRCVEAGFTFYTIDPSDHVDEGADHHTGAVLETRMESLPWEALEASAADLGRLYLGKCFFLDGLSLEIDKADLARAAVKYGRAVAHTAMMFRHLASRMGHRPFDLEISVDETDSPTSVVEHFFVARELKRLGVEWVSLAPRFVGRFEKAVDYIGEIAPFADSFARHISVARCLGPYKLSLHSGSDKFSLYPVVARLAGELVHLKTAGTSYLEALRVIAGTDPDLFREILVFALDCYPRDRVSYHVSADTGRVPDPKGLKDTELTALLDQFDSRQVLHVTYGSVLTARLEDGTTRFRDRLLESLRSNEEAYYAALHAHLERHLAPFDG